MQTFSIEKNPYCRGKKGMTVKIIFKAQLFILLKTVFSG